jgi:hypothetical protein
VLFLGIQSGKTYGSIIVNEIMPCNVSTQLSDKMNYTGWVELYNPTNTSVNISGYTFINEYMNLGEKKTQSWTITGSMVVPAQGYTLIYFDEEEGSGHVNYKLETSGGDLILKDVSGIEVDRISYDMMYPHVSWGKVGSDQGYMTKPTPKAANADYYDTNRRVGAPTFSHAPGRYDSSISVSLQSVTVGADIYYTLDGSEPTENSTKYIGNPISVTKTTVIRARAYHSRYILSEISTGSYIFMDDYHRTCNGFTVPIVSISTDPDNFFGNQQGIYVKGTNGISSGKSCDPGIANYNQDWKRPVNFEYFVDGKQVVSQELDAAVMGGCSRQYTQKSLKLTASKKLGNNKISDVNGGYYDFFPHKNPGMVYKSLQLRNNGNDYDANRIRDGFIQSLIKGRMDVDYQGYQPVAFYINGEYWGHMDLRERTNKDFVYTNYGLDEEEIDLLEIDKGAGDSNAGYMAASTGNTDAYRELLAASRVGADQDDYYDKMNRLMDLNEYLEYQILQQYVVNTDWPGNNTKVWRENTTGRFRWIIYDTDFGFGLYGPAGENYCDVNLNMLEFCIDRTPSNFSNKDSWMVELFKNLMSNQKIRQKFLDKYILHLGTTFIPQRVVGVLDSVRNVVNSEICAHWKKFTQGWSAGTSMTDFANQRTDIVYTHLRSYYNSKFNEGMGNPVNLTISSNISNADFIINGERLNASSFTGKYYQNRNLTVQPIAPAGYKFKEWNLASSTVLNAFLDEKTEWRYYYQNHQPENIENLKWNEAGYYDGNWASGSGCFGYGSREYTNTVVLDYGPDGDNKYITSYFRTTIDLGNLNEVDEIKATVIYDDGFVLYINGQEVKRENLPTGEITYESMSGPDNFVNDAKVTFEISKEYLRSGVNTIAVEMHQNVPGSSDLTFKMDLSGMVNRNDFMNNAFNGTLTGATNLVATFEKVTYKTPSLFINELCISNGSESGFENGYGVYGDWLEIYNAGTEAVDLAGMYLIYTAGTDKTEYIFPATSPLETTILPGGYKIIWADKSVWQGPLHANFKLSAGSVSHITLQQKDDNGELRDVDKVMYAANVHLENESYGRITDGAEGWKVFEYCPEREIYFSTPGESNGSKGECNTVFIDESLAEESSVTMKLYPNPVKYELNVKVMTEDAYSVQVYDTNGRLMESLANVNEATVTFNMENYRPGIYIVKVVTQEKVYQQRFIKY